MKGYQRNISAFVFCLLVAAACLLLCSKSSPLYPINDWTDANAYLSGGKGMLAGRVIYRDLYEHKGPMVYGLHALCALISSNSFLGVFILEVLAVSLFLMAVYKLLVLYGAKQTAWMLLPAAAALTLASVSFQSGDSTEELCLPLLAWSLYFLLRWLKLQAPERMPAKTLVTAGVLCGFVLWIKFTMLGFFLPWIAGLLLYHLLRGQVRAGFSSLGWFLCGIGIATLPWLLYFGLNGALYDWFKVYFYDNLFLYSQTEPLTFLDRIQSMLKSAWDFFIQNPVYTVPLALGVIWFTISRRHAAAEKVWLWSMLLFLGVGVFIAGKDYLYYGFIFSAFAAFLLLPICRWLDRALNKHALLNLLFVCTLGMLSLLYCFTASPNAKDLLEPKEDTMQYRFAAVISEVPDATLLNYHFMDAGFYTAAGITPSVKYFHYTNVPLDEMLAEQTRYIEDGVTDFVVSREPLPDTVTARYTLVAQEEATQGFWYDAVYLYERNDLLSGN